MALVPFSQLPTTMALSCLSASSLLTISRVYEGTAFAWILTSISFLSYSQSFGAATAEVANTPQMIAKAKRFMCEAP